MFWLGTLSGVGDEDVEKCREGVFMVIVIAASCRGMILGLIGPRIVEGGEDEEQEWVIISSKSHCASFST